MTRNLKYRGRFLLLTEKRIGLPEGFYENRESFDLAVLNGEKPAGYYVTAYGLCPVSYTQLETGNGGICGKEP